MLLLLPILVPLIGGIFVFRQKNETYRDWLVVTLIVITAVMVLANCTMPTQRLWLLTIQGDLGLVLNSDWLSKFFMVLAVCIWAPVVVFTKPYIRHAGQGNQFMGFYTMTLGVLMGLAQAANFVTMYMFFEMMSLITVPLVLHNATPAARRAGFKYLGYSVFGAGMALAGYFFIAYYLTVPDFQPGGAIDFSRAAEHQPLLLVAYCLMIVGFGAKAGMMPMQSWLPAAHPVAPAPASAVLSGVITKGGVVAVIRVTYYMFGPEFLAGSWPQYVLLTLTLATVFVGSMLAYREKQLKRRLAYSTVSQVSYVLFGLMLLTPDGVQASLLQMVFHALAKDTLFLAAGAIIFSTNCTRVDQLRGIGRRMPGNHVVLHPGGPLPDRDSAHGGIREQVVPAHRQPEGTDPGLWRRRAGGAGGLRPADGGIPAAGGDRGILPRPGFYYGAAGSGSPDDMAHDCLCRGCGADGSAARRPAALAGSSGGPAVPLTVGKL